MKIQHILELYYFFILMAVMEIYHDNIWKWLCLEVLNICQMYWAASWCFISFYQATDLFLKYNQLWTVYTLGSDMI
jgi:hypothetical protein